MLLFVVCADTLLLSMLKMVLFRKGRMCIHMALLCYNWYQDGKWAIPIIHSNNNLLDNGYLRYLYIYKTLQCSLLFRLISIWLTLMYTYRVNQSLRSWHCKNWLTLVLGNHMTRMNYTLWLKQPTFVCKESLGCVHPWERYY